MLKRIAAVIRKALAAMFRTFGRLAALPFQALGGGGYDAEEALESLDESQSDITEYERQQEKLLDQARAVQRYAAKSVVDNAPAPLSSDMSPEVRGWARGLSYDECMAICATRPEGVSAHLQGLFPISGVRKIQPLEPQSWSRRAEPQPDPAPSCEPIVSYAI